MRQSLQRTIEIIEDNESHPFVKHAVSALGIEMEDLKLSGSEFRYQDRLYNLTQIANYLMENDMQIVASASKPINRRKSLDFTLRGPSLSVPYTPLELNSYKLEIERKKLEHKLSVAKNRKEIRKNYEKKLEKLKATINQEGMKTAPLRIFDSKVDGKIEAIRQKINKEAHERETKAFHDHIPPTFRKIKQIVNDSPHKKKHSDEYDERLLKYINQKMDKSEALQQDLINNRLSKNKRSESEIRARKNRDVIEKAQQQREIELFREIHQSYEQSRERREDCYCKKKNEITTRNAKRTERMAKMHSPEKPIKDKTSAKIDLVRKNMQSEYNKKSEEIAHKLRKKLEDRNLKFEALTKEMQRQRLNKIQKQRAYEEKVCRHKGYAETLAQEKAKLNEEYNYKLRNI